MCIKGLRSTRESKHYKEGVAMYYGKEQEYTIASPETVKDALNHETTSYVNMGTAKIHIIVQDRSMIKNNDLDLYKSTLVGFTRNLNIQKGWRVGTGYNVKSAMPHRNMNVLYLEEITNGR